MMQKKLLGLAAFIFAGAAFAQAPAAGVLSNVVGTVTVNDGSRVVTGASGGAIPNGARILTNSASSASLRLANGCAVDLKPNQAVTVLSSMSCSELAASVQTVVPPGAVVGTADPSVGDFIIVATGVGVTLAAIDGLRNRGRRLSGS